MSEIDWSKAPEGATHYSCVNDMFYIFIGPHSGKYWSVSRQDWMAAGRIKESGHMSKRPSTAWSGEGLPPVGIDIEFKSSGGEWLVGQYIGQFNGKIIAGCHATGVVGYLQSGEMRPIRTPEQIAADEREAAVAAMLELDPYQPNTTLGMMSRADFCRTLHDAGYRKQADK